jgi:RNA polymerase sigma factor (sigma-70 family)
MPKKEPLFEESRIQELIERFREGDNKAFGDLWKNISPYVFRVVKPGLDRDTTDELMGRICIRLYEEGLRKYNPVEGVSFISWVRAIANNLKKNEIKKKRPTTFTAVADEEGRPVEDIFHHEESPYRIVMEWEKEIRDRAIMLLPELLKKLNEEERVAVEASIVSGWTDKRIAAHFEKDEKSASKYRMMRSRALKKLRMFYLTEGIMDFPVKI